MAKLKINGNVKIGGIYECHFGSYKHKTITGQTTNDPIKAPVNV